MVQRLRRPRSTKGLELRFLIGRHAVKGDVLRRSDIVMCHQSMLAFPTDTPLHNVNGRLIESAADMLSALELSSHVQLKEAKHNGLPGLCEWLALCNGPLRILAEDQGPLHTISSSLASAESDCKAPPLAS